MGGELFGSEVHLKAPFYRLEYSSAWYVIVFWFGFVFLECPFHIAVRIGLVTMLMQAHLRYYIFYINVLHTF